MNRLTARRAAIWVRAYPAIPSFCRRCSASFSLCWCRCSMFSFTRFKTKTCFSARALSAAGITMKSFSAIPCRADAQKHADFLRVSRAPQPDSRHGDGAVSGRRTFRHALYPHNHLPAGRYLRRGLGHRLEIPAARRHGRPVNWFLALFGIQGPNGSTKRAGPWLPSSSPACSKIWAQTC